MSVKILSSQSNQILDMDIQIDYLLWQNVTQFLFSIELTTTLQQQQNKANEMISLKEIILLILYICNYIKRRMWSKSAAKKNQ